MHAEEIVPRVFQMRRILNEVLIDDKLVEVELPFYSMWITADEHYITMVA